MTRNVVDTGLNVFVIVDTPVPSVARVDLLLRDADDLAVEMALASR